LRELHIEIILVHSITKLHPILSQTTEFSLCNQSQITQTPHKEATLNPTKPTHPLCTQQPPQARIPLTLQDFTQLYKMLYEQLKELEQD